MPATKGSGFDSCHNSKTKQKRKRKKKKKKRASGGKLYLSLGGRISLNESTSSKPL